MANNDDGWQYQNILDDRQADAWMEFVLSENTSALAEYLSAGGEVDAKVRKILISILMGERRSSGKGNRDNWRDYVTYSEVESNIAFKKMNKTQACKQYARITHREQRTVEMQYDRGSKFFKSESLDPKKESPTTEK
jgi:hypothetical protein